MNARVKKALMPKGNYSWFWIGVILVTTTSVGIAVILSYLSGR